MNSVLQLSKNNQIFQLIKSLTHWPPCNQPPTIRAIMEGSGKGDARNVNNDQHERAVITIATALSILLIKHCHVLPSA